MSDSEVPSPLMAALRRAPKLSDEESAKCRALMAQVKSDPSTWLSEEQFWAKVKAGRRDAT